MMMKKKVVTMIYVYCINVINSIPSPNTYMVNIIFIIVIILSIKRTTTTTRRGLGLGRDCSRGYYSRCCSCSRSCSRSCRNI